MPGQAGAVNARFRPSAASKAGGTIALVCPAHPALRSGPGDQACCCVARAVVRVVMPPAPGRPRETELLLCGHHYRVSRAALAAALARVEELPVSRGDAGAWFRGGQDRPAHGTAFPAG